MRISDWSSDVCSSDLARGPRAGAAGGCGKAAHRRGREARRAVRRLVEEGKCAGAQGANLCRAGRGARQPQRHGEEPAPGPAARVAATESTRGPWPETLCDRNVVARSPALSRAWTDRKSGVEGKRVT